MAYLGVCRTRLRILGLLTHSREGRYEFGLVIGAGRGSVRLSIVISLETWKLENQ